MWRVWLGLRGPGGLTKTPNPILFRPPTKNHVSVSQYNVFEFGTGVKSKTLTPLTTIVLLFYKVGGTVSSLLRSILHYVSAFSTVFSKFVQV